MPPAKVQALPPDAVIVQFTHVETPAAAAAVAAGEGGLGGEAVGQVGGPPGEEPVEHFLELLVTGQVTRCGSLIPMLPSFKKYFTQQSEAGRICMQKACSCCTSLSLPASTRSHSPADW